MSNQTPTIKKPEELVLLRQGGRILGDILKHVAKMARPGITTSNLEETAEKMILAAGGRPSFKNYQTHNEKPFPTVLCTSINQEIVHAPALPSRELKEGDLIGIDIGMQYPAQNGFYTDAAMTVPVGKVSKEAARLVKITQKALYIGIKAIKQGGSVADIGRAIENFVKPYKVGIVRELVGHGVGYAVHEAPRIPNFFDVKLRKIKLQEGMVLALEPMFTLGDWHIKTGKDGFTCVTADNSLAAHFEHTIIITKKGAEVIT